MSGLRGRALRALQIAALALALGFIALGACRGQAAEVLRKAVYVCLECIGVAG